MTKEIHVPDIGDFENVEVIEVLVKKGDTVKKNDPLITLESDKSSVEVPSTDEGVIEELKVKVGDKVSKGDLILSINSPNVESNAKIPPVTEKIISEAEISLKKELLGEKYKFLTEGLEVTIGIYNEIPIKIELPNQIECKIYTTDAAIKGQTVSSSYKPALLENGINILVPPFVESGDTILVDTRTIEYIKKV